MITHNAIVVVSEWVAVLEENTVTLHHLIFEDPIHHQVSTLRTVLITKHSLSAFCAKKPELIGLDTKTYRKLCDGLADQLSCIEEERLRCEEPS